jgi:hypothetical protein
MVQISYGGDAVYVSKKLMAVLLLLATIGSTVAGCSSSSDSEIDRNDMVSIDLEDDSEEDTSWPTYETPECGDAQFDERTGLRRLPYLQDAQPTSVRVVWTVTDEDEWTLEYTADPDGDWNSVTPSEEFFPTSRTEDPVEYTAMEAQLEGLDAGRTYCYRVLDGEEVVASGLSFTTAWKDESRPVRILAFGDSGNGSDEQKQVRDEFMNHEYDIFLHLGDMAYGSGTFVEFEERMFEVYEQFLHGTVAWPTMGNHEFKTDGGQPYLDVYYLPEQAMQERDNERYYSFDYGNIHFVSLDSNDFILGLIFADRLVPEGSKNEVDMIDWLRADLAASDADWKIVFFHHPPYTSSVSRDPSGLVRAVIMPELEAAGVDLVLSGHDHFYERSKPIWQDAVAAGDDDAITYIVAGFGGTGMTETVDGNWHTAAKHDDMQGFVDMTVDGCTATGTVVTRDGNTVDSFELNGCD